MDLPIEHSEIASNEITVGCNDVAIARLRSTWERELLALRDGRPIKHWARSITLCTSGL